MELYPPEAGNVHQRDKQLALEALAFYQESEERQDRIVLTNLLIHFDLNYFLTIISFYFINFILFVLILL